MKRIMTFLAILAITAFMPMPKQRILLIGDSYACRAPAELFEAYRSDIVIDRAAVRSATRYQMADIIDHWPETDYDIVFVMWGESEHRGRGTSFEKTQKYYDDICALAKKKFPDAHFRIIPLRDMEAILSNPPLRADDAHPNDEGFSRLLLLDEEDFYY